MASLLRMKEKENSAFKEKENKFEELNDELNDYM